MTDNTITDEQIAAGAAVLDDAGKPVGRNTAIMVWDAMIGAATSGDAPADLQQLKALALAATPGPWFYQENSDAYTHIVRPTANPNRIIASGTQTSEAHGEPTGRYIAAANPAVVLGLIARIERATAHAQPVNTSSERVENAAGNEQVESAAAPATASGDELPPLSDVEYQNILGPVLSREGMRRYRNADPLNLDPSDLRAMIDRARAAVSAATKPTADLSKLKRYHHNEHSLNVHEDPIGEFYSVRDVQSLLATKPVAASALPGCLADRLYEAISIAHDRASHAGSTPRMKKWADTAADLSAALAAATPAASTTGAAQTAPIHIGIDYATDYLAEVRDQALEEAAKACDSYAQAAMPQYRNDANGALCCARNIRALKRPTPTHSSEASDGK